MINRSLREKIPSRILVSLSCSLLCLYLIFLIGIEQTSSRVGCIIVAVLIHYFTLASIAWMGVEATNLYLKLVKVFNSGVRHFMIKASIAAWGKYTQTSPYSSMVFLLANINIMSVVLQ